MPKLKEEIDKFKLWKTSTPEAADLDIQKRHLTSVASDNICDGLDVVSDFIKSCNDLKRRPQANVNNPLMPIF